MRLNGHQSQSGNYFRKFAEHYLDLFHPGEMANSLNVEILFGNLPSTISMYLFLNGEKATEEWRIIYFFYKAS